MTYPSRAKLRRKRELARKLINHLLIRYERSHAAACLAWHDLLGVSEVSSFPSIGAVRRELRRAGVWGDMSQRVDLLAAPLRYDFEPEPDYELAALGLLLCGLSSGRSYDSRVFSLHRAFADTPPHDELSLCDGAMKWLHDAWHARMGETMRDRMVRLAARLGVGRAELAKALEGEDFAGDGYNPARQWLADWPDERHASPAPLGVAERVRRVLAGAPTPSRRSTVGDVRKLLFGNVPTLTPGAVYAAFPEFARETRQMPRPAAPPPPSNPATPAPIAEAALPNAPATAGGAPAAPVNFAEVLGRFPADTQQAALVRSLIGPDGPKKPRQTSVILREVCGERADTRQARGNLRALVCAVNKKLRPMSGGTLEIKHSKRLGAYRAVVYPPEQCSVPESALPCVTPREKPSRANAS